jgi:hypothetical protein
MNGVREELKNTQKEWVEEEEWQYKEEAPSVNMRRKLRYECCKLFTCTRGLFCTINKNMITSSLIPLHHQSHDTRYISFPFHSPFLCKLQSLFIHSFILFSCSPFSHVHVFSCHGQFKYGAIVIRETKNTREKKYYLRPDIIDLLWFFTQIKKSV